MRMNGMVGAATAAMLNGPSGLFVMRAGPTAGRIYVADTYNARIQKFSGAGAALAARLLPLAGTGMGAAAAPPVPPRALATPEQCRNPAP